jgi:hypothetical protein
MHATRSTQFTHARDAAGAEKDCAQAALKSANTLPATATLANALALPTTGTLARVTPLEVLIHVLRSESRA